MSKCPYRFTAEDLADVPLNGTKEMPRGCGPNISGTQPGSGYQQLVSSGFHWPDNNEFQWGGLGSSCCMNAFDYGCDGGPCVSGKRGTVQRISYNAPPPWCCTSQMQLFNKGTTLDPNWVTCDPKYRTGFTTDGCDATLSQYCPNFWFNDGEESYPGISDNCKSWLVTATSNGRSVLADYMQNVCSEGTNFKSDLCQKWCTATKSSSSPFQSLCDAPIEKYCTNNPTDPNCACIAPPQNITELSKHVPSSIMCWYGPCNQLTGSGLNYITNGMKQSLDNCKTTTCIIESGDVKVEGQGNEIIFDNNCGCQYVSGAECKDNSTPGPGPTPNPNPNPAPGPIPNPIPFAFVGISSLSLSLIVLAVVGILIFFLFLRK